MFWSVGAEVVVGGRCWLTYLYDSGVVELGMEPVGFVRFGRGWSVLHGCGYIFWVGSVGLVVGGTLSMVWFWWPQRMLCSVVGVDDDCRVTRLFVEIEVGAFVPSLPWSAASMCVPGYLHLNLHVLSHCMLPCLLPWCSFGPLFTLPFLVRFLLPLVTPTFRHNVIPSLSLPRLRPWRLMTPSPTFSSL